VFTCAENDFYAIFLRRWSTQIVTLWHYRENADCRKDGLNAIAIVQIKVLVAPWRKKYEVVMSSIY
jgi:hypothetical protein